MTSHARGLTTNSAADLYCAIVENAATLTAKLRATHDVCNEHGDIATASLIEVWVDETERRTWFLFESLRQ